jgi:SNF2 family DNA or RNA helicase
VNAINLFNNCIYLHVNENNVLLNAKEIYSVLFEGVTNLHGIQLCKDDFDQIGLTFSEFTASPSLSIEVINGIISCQLFGSYDHSEANIPEVNGTLVDYAILDGTWHPLPIGTIETVSAYLHSISGSTFGKLTLSQYLHLIKSDSSPIKIVDRTNNELSALRISEKLTNDLPAGFIGKLYPYQLNGFRWLSYMAINRMGAIIADEMGLGKTIQVICLFLEYKNRSETPFLVVCPATLLENWKREIAKFAPSLNVLIHGGSRRTGFPDVLKSYDVVVCSFDTAVSDISLLRNITFRLLVVDEAQGIKNPGTKRRIQINTLNRSTSIAVTGTPVENHLTDLWSLIDFIAPSFLGTLTDFEHNFSDTTDSAIAIEPFVSPMILRRTIAQVASDLPERIDIPQPLVFDSASAGAYDSLRLHALGDSGSSLSSLVHLRMFCTHPWLCDLFKEYDDPTVCSVKMQRLFQILEEIISVKEKAILFTSFQESIDLIKDVVKDRFSIWTGFIDGRTPVNERQKMVDVYSSVLNSALLVLNPRAAGTGLNITAANHVIHYNLEWNPAIEDQASARAHRRGQQKVVTVHRFYYVNTVEDVINDRMAHKRILSSNAVIGTNVEDVDQKDILRALKLSPVQI